MAQIDKNMTVGDILDIDRETAVYFLNMGMHCLGCPASRGETIAEACEVHAWCMVWMPTRWSRRSMHTLPARNKKQRL